MTDRQHVESDLETNPYGDLEREIVPQDDASGPSGSKASAITGDEIEAPEISDAQVQQMHDEIDSILNAPAPAETDFDPSSNLLPAAMRAALRKTLPRQALQRFANMTPMIDGDGNQLLVRETAVKVQAVVVDYIADKIFGERLSFEIVDQGVTKAQDINIIYAPGSDPRSVYQVVAWARVRCSVLRNDGSAWIKEDFSSMAAETDRDTNHGRAHRIAEMGAVTAARRRALQQYGRVFGGFDVRDFENLIGTIRQSQKKQEAQRREADSNAKSQEAAFATDSAGGGNRKRTKPALSVDPALRAGTPGTAAGTTPVRPSGVTVRRKSDPAPSAPSFRLMAASKDEPVQIADGEIFAKQLIKIINKSKTVEAANAIIALNREGVALLDATEKWRKFAGQVMAAHEVKLALLDSRAKAAAEKAARKEATRKRKDELARKRAASAAADKAAAEVDGRQDDHKPSDDRRDSGRTTKGARSASSETSQAPQPARRVTGSRPLAETPDHAGFGGPSTPEPSDEAQARPAKASAWNPAILKLEVVDGKVTNVGSYGQSVLDAVKSAPTIAELDAFMERIKPDLERVNKEAASFISSTADMARKRLSAD